MVVSTVSIPFTRPTVAPHQLDYVSEVFDSGQLSGDGPFTDRASALLSDIHLGADVLLTTNCTAALELSALLLELQPGDEVIVPSFTFVTSASAFALHGARIVFADIDPVTWSIDPDQVEQLITERTRAVVVVHYGGVAADLDRLEALTSDRGIALIEDNAHGLFASDASDRPLGTRGMLSTLSFHATKNLSCGEGGAIVINEPSLRDRAEILREKGTDRRRFLRGKVDKYRWMDVGSSFLPSDVLAAILVAQLEHAATIQERRQSIWSRYADGLRGWADRSGVRFFADDVPGTPRRHPAHLFALRLPTPQARAGLLEYLHEAGITGTFHYVPLHTSPAGERVGSAPLGCPVTDAVSAELLRLPLFCDMSDSDVAAVIERVSQFVP